MGKSHALCAVGHALVEAGHSVLCAPAYGLVQELLGAKRDLDLPRALRKLDLFEVILLDDLGYVQQSPDEAEVLFTLLAERYERRSVMVTSNLASRTMCFSPRRDPSIAPPDGRPPRTRRGGTDVGTAPAPCRDIRPISRSAREGHGRRGGLAQGLVGGVGAAEIPRSSRVPRRLNDAHGCRFLSRVENPKNPGNRPRSCS